MGYKLVISDMDGTLCSFRTRVIDSYSSSVFRQIHDKGILTALATGRPEENLDKFLNETPFDYFVFSNGAKVLDTRTRQIIYSSEIDSAASAEMMQFFEEQKIACFVFAQGKRVTSDLCMQYQKQLQHPHRLLGEIRCIEHFPQYIQEHGLCFEKANLFFDASDKQRVFDLIRKRYGDAYFITSSEDDNLEITNLKANKGEALACIMETARLSKDEVIAMGDNHNDLPMLKQAGLSIAPSNATADVLDYADIVTSACENSGPARTLEKLLLND